MKFRPWKKVSWNLKYGIIEVQMKNQWIHKHLRISDFKNCVLKENVYHLYSATNKYNYDIILLILSWRDI